METAGSSVTAATCNQPGFTFHMEGPHSAHGSSQDIRRRALCARHHSHPGGPSEQGAAVGSAWQALPGREGEVGTTVPPQMTPCSLMMGRAGLTQQLVTVRQVQAKTGPQESRTPSPPPVLTVSKGCLESKPPHTCGARHPRARRVRQGGVIRAPNQIDLRGPGAGQVRPVPRGSHIPSQRPSPQAKGRRVCPHPRNGRTQFHREGPVGRPVGGAPSPNSTPGERKVIRAHSSFNGGLPAADQGPGPPFPAHPRTPPAGPLGNAARPGRDGSTFPGRPRQPRHPPGPHAVMTPGPWGGG